jgi:hypothetical protein
MSYELRQPLNSMIERMISVLANEHEALSPSGRDSLRGVLADGNTLMQMLQNILELWRLKQGEVTVEVQDVNLAEVIGEAIFSVRDTLQPDVVFEKRIPSALPKIRTDLGSSINPLPPARQRREVHAPRSDRPGAPARAASPVRDGHRHRHRQTTGSRSSTGSTASPSPDSRHLTPASAHARPRPDREARRLLSPE